MKKITRGKFLAFGLGIIIGVAAFAVIFYVRGYNNKENIITSLVKNKYIEEVSDETIEDGKYKGILEALGDKYSAYYTAEEYQKLQENVNATNMGIGVIMYKDAESEAITINSVMEDSPAEKAGIATGDIITAVDGTSVSGMELDDIASLIKEAETGQVTLTIEREGETTDYELTLEEIEQQTVGYVMLENDIGYIMISTFGQGTAKEFEEAFADLTDQRMTGLIVDLRGNQGGLVSAVTDILGSFMPKGLVVYTKTRDGEIKKYESECENPVKIPMVVLVNEATASAAEIFAGAVKDRGVATIAGATTFGKGIVQNIIPLNDGSAIKLTTAAYYTPSGNNLNGQGITPDVEVVETGTFDLSENDDQYQKAIEIITSGQAITYDAANDPIARGEDPTAGKANSDAQVAESGNQAIDPDSK